MFGEVPRAALCIETLFSTSGTYLSSIDSNQSSQEDSTIKSYLREGGAFRYMSYLYRPSYVVIVMVFAIVLAGYGFIQGATQPIVLGVGGTIACLVLLGLARLAGEL